MRRKNLSGGKTLIWRQRQSLGRKTPVGILQARRKTASAAGGSICIKSAEEQRPRSVATISIIWLLVVRESRFISWEFLGESPTLSISGDARHFKYSTHPISSERVSLLPQLLSFSQNEYWTGEYKIFTFESEKRV